MTYVRRKNPRDKMNITSNRIAILREYTSREYFALITRRQITISSVSPLIMLAVKTRRTRNVAENSHLTRSVQSVSLFFFLSLSLSPASLAPLLPLPLLCHRVRRSARNRAIAANCDTLIVSSAVSRFLASRRVVHSGDYSEDSRAVLIEAYLIKRAGAREDARQSIFPAGSIARVQSARGRARERSV